MIERLSAEIPGCGSTKVTETVPGWQVEGCGRRLSCIASGREGFTCAVPRDTPSPSTAEPNDRRAPADTDRGLGRSHGGRR
jgi:hypothetical protein